MYRHALFLLVLALGSAPALAREQATFDPQCKPLAEIKAQNKEAKFTPLTIGQYHFAEGFYAGSPITPEGPPPGNGAILVEAKGHGAIAWTRGAEVCITIIAMGQGHGVYMPMPLTAPQLALLKAVHTGKLEEPPAAERDDSGDLHL